MFTPHLATNILNPLIVPSLLPFSDSWAVCHASILVPNDSALLLCPLFTVLDRPLELSRKDVPCVSSIADSLVWLSKAYVFALIDFVSFVSLDSCSVRHRIMDILQSVHLA